MKITKSLARRLNRISGFSLIETSLGMSVVGIVVVALYSGMQSGVLRMQITRETLRATQVMAEKLDTIRLYGWDKINQTGYIPTSFQEPLYPNTCKPGYYDAQTCSQYKGSITVGPAPVSESYSNSLRLVTVTLNWQTGNTPRTSQMSTLVSEHGLHKFVY